VEVASHVTPETPTSAEPASRRAPVFRRWRPRSQEDLERALEEYAVFQDGCKIKQPGKIAGDADNDMAWQRICCQQNPEIDRRMARLLDPDHRCYSPVLWRLLDAFYRKGLCDEARGWQVAARASGLPNFRWRDGRNRRHFDKLIDIAVEQLWLAATDVPRKR